LKSWFKKYFPKQSLGSKVVLSIILVSSFVTLISTGVQLYIEYKRDVNLLFDRVDQVRSGYLKSITNSMWAVDKDQLTLLLDGIYNLPDIERVEIVEDKTLYIGVGETPLRQMKEYSFPLIYSYNQKNINLGNLHVYISLKGIYQRLIDRIAIILGTQAIKTFIVSIMSLLIFYYFVTRHLNALFKSVSEMREKKNIGEIKLETNNKKTLDEFDVLVTAFNQLINNLRESYLALQKSEERFELAMQGANDGLWDWSVDKKEIYYSDRYKEIIGIRKNTFIGSYAEWSNRIHPGDRGETLGKLGRTLRGEIDQFSHTYRLRHEHGYYKWVLTRGIVVKGSDDKPVRMVGTVMDITQRKEAEDKLANALTNLENEQGKRIVAERLACVGELSASIAHEIRNPLCSIVGAVEHLNDVNITKEDQGVMYNILHRETKRLDRVLSDFLNFTKQREPQIISTDVKNIIEETISTLKLDCEVSHIKFIEQYDHNVESVYCDPDLIRQVLWNLIKNSIQSIKNSGYIEVCTLKKGKVCELSIKDNGEGIENDKKKNIVEPFVTYKRHGTGLGLAISNKILSNHDSELIIESQPNSGTLVKFYLKVV
tara:strand:+ start:8608 stop:10401 length:1794 start_codon:yes stop_codon:yes gene_type:complete